MDISSGNKFYSFLIAFILLFLSKRWMLDNIAVFRSPLNLGSIKLSNLKEVFSMSQ